MNDRTSDAMLDIETMSSAPDAAVVAIGVRLFDQSGTGKGFEVYIDQREAARIGSVSDQTMTWWRTQDTGVQARVFGGATHPADAVAKLIAFVNEHKPKRIWANSPQFDVVIMRHLCKQVGLEFPFHFRDERDCRTMFSLAKALGIEYSDCYEGIMVHNPLDDASAQAAAVAKVLRNITRKKEKANANG